MSGGGGGGTTTTVNQLFSPEEAARREKVMAEAERIYGATAGTISSAPYPGAQPVGPSADTTQAQQMLRAFGLGGAQDLSNQASAATQFGLRDVLFPETNPALRATQAASIRPVTEAYTDPGGVFQSIRTGAVGAGGYGQGSRQGIAEGVAMGKYLDTVGDVSSRVATEGYNRGLDVFSRTLATAPTIQQMGTMPAQIVGAVGQQQEGYAQAQEDYDAAARQWELNAPWVPLQNYANVVYGGSTAGSQTNATGAAPQTNPVMTAMGGAALGAYIGPMLGMTGPMGAGIGLLASFLAT